MKEMLNIQSPIPLYRQLADILRSKIRSGEYAEGMKIPSETELAARFGIGRPTARQATELLVRKQMLTRRRGAGTFVQKKQHEIDLFSLAGTLSAFQKSGLSTTRYLLKPPALNKIPNDQDNPFAGDRAYFFSRLSLVDDLPLLLEDIYLSPALFPGFDAVDLNDRPLSLIIEDDYYMKPVSGKQNFKIIYLNKKQAADLSISTRQPILSVQRFLHFSQQKNGIYSDLFCRTDRFVFSQRLKGAFYD